MLVYFRLSEKHNGKYFELGTPADIVLDPPLSAATQIALCGSSSSLNLVFGRLIFARCTDWRCTSRSTTLSAFVSLRHPFGFLILPLRFLGGVLVQLLAFVRLLPRQLTSVRYPPRRLTFSTDSSTWINHGWKLQRPWWCCGGGLASHDVHAFHILPSLILVSYLSSFMHVAKSASACVTLISLIIEFT
jgi:hypothetical protein